MVLGDRYSREKVMYEVMFALNHKSAQCIADNRNRRKQLEDVLDIALSSLVKTNN